MGLDCPHFDLASDMLLGKDEIASNSSVAANSFFTAYLIAYLSRLMEQHIITFCSSGHQWTCQTQLMPTATSQQGSQITLFPRLFYLRKLNDVAITCVSICLPCICREQVKA